MHTKGFVPNFSDTATNGVPFNATVNSVPNTPCISWYLSVVGAGGVVYQNYLGDLQYFVALANTTYIVGATQILASGNVNGTARTTSATGIAWYGDTKPLAVPA